MRRDILAGYLMLVLGGRMSLGDNSWSSFSFLRLVLTFIES